MKVVIRLDIKRASEEDLRKEMERISAKRVKKKKGTRRKKSGGAKVKKEEKEAIII